MRGTGLGCHAPWWVRVSLPVTTVTLSWVQRSFTKVIAASRFLVLWRSTFVFGPNHIPSGTHPSAGLCGIYPMSLSTPCTSVCAQWPMMRTGAMGTVYGMKTCKDRLPNKLSLLPVSDYARLPRFICRSSKDTCQTLDGLLRH